MKRVLILLAAYNGNPWLSAQVVSILSQQDVDLRLIIGDDCSSDGAVDALAHNDKLQKIMFNIQAGGAGQSFLRLLRTADLSRVEYLAFSDQDDVWYENKLSRAIGTLEHESADGYSAAVTAFWPDYSEKLLSQNPNQTDLDFLFEGAGQGCTFVLRGDFAREIQMLIRDNGEMFAAMHYHDWPIYVLSRVLQKRWFFDPEPCMRYRQHGSNDTGARTKVSAVIKRIDLIRNGWYLQQVQQNIAVAQSLDNAVIPSDFLAAWNDSRILLRRLRLAIILLRRGRRRFTDRIVLSLSSLLGWI